MKHTEMVGSQTVTIETRWYESLWVPLTVPLALLMRFQPLQKLIKQQRLVKFCIVGGTSTVTALVTLWLMTDVVGLYYLGSNLVAAAVSTAIWFAGNARWTFSDRKTTGWSVPKTALVRAAAIGLHTGLLALFVEVFGVWYMVGAMLAVLVEFMLSYTLSNWWIWRRQ